MYIGKIKNCWYGRKIWLPVKSAAWISTNSITQVMQYLVAYGSMGNSLVTNWKEDPTPAFLVSKRSKSHQFLAIAFCMNSQQTFRKKIYKRGHFKWLALQIDNFHGYFFSSFLSKVGLDSSILIVHALNTKRSFYPEKSHVKRAASVLLRAVGAQGAVGHCVLKWGFMWIFHGNQDAALK